MFRIKQRDFPPLEQAFCGQNGGGPDVNIRPSVTMRFIRRRPGAQKGNAINLGVAVRTALRAKPLCQP